MIQLGQKVKDPITGYEGTAVSKTQWLYGCTRIGVQAKIGEDGKVPEMYCFDEPQLESVKPGENEIPGGPRPSPKLHPDPIR